MASANATTVLNYLSGQPGDQYELTYAVCKLLESLGTDGDDANAVDDVISQLEAVFAADSGVMEEVKTALTDIRLKITG